jgi:hypothetical protein
VSRRSVLVVGCHVWRSHAFNTLATGCKIGAIRRAAGIGAPLVASANLGCAMHLGTAGLDVRDPTDLLADALDV